MSLSSKSNSSSAINGEADIEELREKEKMLDSFLPKRVFNDFLMSLHPQSFDGLSCNDSPSRNSTSNERVNRSRSQSIVSNASKLQASALYSREAKDVSIVFCDIVGFSRIAKDIPPSDVMEMLQNLFYRFDSICKNYNLLKLDTIGDAYFCASGLLRQESDSITGMVDVATCNGLRCGIGGESRKKKKLQKIEKQQEEYTKSCAARALAVAKEMIREARKVEVPIKYSSEQQNREEREFLNVRVGIHVGNVTYGILGQHSPKLMCVGSTVNIAEQMEKTSLPNLIHVSKDFNDLIETINTKSRKTHQIHNKEFSRKFSKRINIENMGEVETWFLDPLEKGEEEIRSSAI